MRKPSIKQVQAFHNLSQGMSKRQAMIKAGYTISTANQASRVLATESMFNLMDSLREDLIYTGLTPEFMAVKIKSWLEAKKVVQGREVPDYDVQIKAFDIWFKIMNWAENKEEKAPNRKITLEEWVIGDNGQNIN